MTRGSRFRSPLSITSKFGERGVVLGLFALPFVIIGISILIDPAERFSRPGPGGPIEFMDSPLWGWLWIAVGIASLIIMLVRPLIKNRPRHFTIDEIGYGLLVIPLALWTVSYGISFVSFLVFEGEMGRDRTYLGSVVYGNFLILVLYLARNLKNTEEVINGAS